VEERRQGKRRNRCQAKHGLLGRAAGVEQVGKGFKRLFLTDHPAAYFMAKAKSLGLT